MLFRENNFRYHLHSLQAIGRGAPPPREQSPALGRASPCTLTVLGSLTVECALVLFLFFMGMVTVISFMEIFPLQVQRQSRLRERVEMVGMGYDSWEGAPQEVSLPDLYTWRPQISVTVLPPVVFTSEVTVHTWTGYQGDGEDQGTEEIVYVAQNGKVYHRRSTCSYLKLSVEGITREELSWRRSEDGSKYRPCEKCIDGKTPSYVYITGSGDHYHSLVTCSGLKRTVRVVPLSQVCEWAACSRCGG